jgi:hypothetical protein
MKQHGVHTRIGGQYLEGVARRGIALEHATDVFADSVEHKGRAIPLVVALPVRT